MYSPVFVSSAAASSSSAITAISAPAPSVNVPSFIVYSLGLGMTFSVEEASAVSTSVCACTGCAIGANAVTVMHSAVKQANSFCFFISLLLSSVTSFDRNEHRMLTASSSIIHIQMRACPAPSVPKKMRIYHLTSFPLSAYM